MVIPPLPEARNYLSLLPAAKSVNGMISLISTILYNKIQIYDNEIHHILRYYTK